MRFINARLAMAAIALAVASVASAAPTVTLVWTDTTGTGTAGGSCIASAPGDKLTLDILITSDAAGVSFSALSYEVSTPGTVTGGTVWAGVDSINDFSGFPYYLPPGGGGNPVTNTATYGGSGLAYVTGSGITCPYPAAGNAFVAGKGFCALGTLAPTHTGEDMGNGIIGTFAAGPGGFEAAFTYTQARAQFEVVAAGPPPPPPPPCPPPPPPPLCGLEIEINALRGGSPTVISGGTKDITSKARIPEGTAPPDATIDDTTLTITSYVGSLVVDQKASGPLTLGVGKGGTGDKLRMDVPACASGQTIDYVAHFSGTASTNGALCAATSGRLSKTCR
jgi:hypothetical protein